MDNGSPEKRVVGGVAEFVNDITSLAELQLKLAALDARIAIRKMTVPLVVAVGGAVLLVTALPVVILGVSELVATALQIKPAWGMVLTGGVICLMAGVVAAVAANRIGPSFSAFRRSREELNRNLAWIRTVLLYSGRAIPPRSR